MLDRLFLDFLYLFSLYSVGFVLNLTYKIFFFLQAFFRPLVNQVLLLFFNLQCLIGPVSLTRKMTLFNIIVSKKSSKIMDDTWKFAYAREH